MRVGLLSIHLLAGLTAGVLIAAEPATVALLSAGDPSVIGTPVTLIANVTPASATGTVDFYDGRTLLGEAPLNSGTATIAVTPPLRGERSIVARYSGAVSNLLTLTVGAVPSSRVPPSRHGRRIIPPPDAHATVPPPAGGAWTALRNQPNFSPDTALLLTDGTVLEHEYCSPNWHRLTPDNTGSYTNGTWSAVASMPTGYGPLYFASAVLPDGRLVVVGGELNMADSCVNDVETNLGAIYDPVANGWTALNPPTGWTDIGDSPSIVLPSGQFLLGRNESSQLALLDPASLTWTALKGSNKADFWNGEEGWTLLADGTFLTVDTNDGTQSEIYNPATDSWSLAGSTVANLVTATEVGPAVLRPDGTIFAAGASGNTAIYTTATGKWAAGPTFPLYNGVQMAVADGPAVLLPGGNVLVGASPFTSAAGGTWKPPVQYYEFDGTNLNPVSAPPHAVSDETFYTRLLPLPSGQVLYSDNYSNIQIYTPSGQANPAWSPAVTSAPGAVTPGQTYTATGTQFNGLSQAAAYGDDVQDATNFPIISITNNATGHVFYCRTHGHSTMAIATGKTPVSTQFDVPGFTEAGPSTLVVIANGIASSPWPLTVAQGSPDMTVASLHTGNFTPGETGVTYSLIVSNMGAMPTSGSVTVTDTLPASLTATSITGLGWTCVLSSLSCSRSDVLAPIASYPNVVLTVNVASNGPASVTNVATVSGGGETNLANDKANDVTAIVLTPQSIVFGPLPNVTFGAKPITLVASATSGLVVTFTAVPSTVCAISGTTLTIVGGGICSVTAQQPGNAAFAAAGPVISDFIVLAAAGGPNVNTGGVVPLFSTTTTIQPGSWISIYGVNLAATTAQWQGDFPTSLGGTTVTINGRKGYFWFVSPVQINLQAPDDTTTGQVNVTVSSAAGSWTSAVVLAPVSPAFCMFDATHPAGIILRSDNSGAYGGGTYDILGPTGTTFGYPHAAVAAKAGDSVVLYGVGFGPTSPVVLSGQPYSGAASTVSKVQLVFGRTIVTPSFAGISSAGLYQINLTIPANLGTGDQAFTAITSGASAQSGLVLSLR